MRGELGRVKQERKESPSKVVMLSVSAPWATRLGHRAASELLCEVDLGLSTWQPIGRAALHRLPLVKGYPLLLQVCRAQM